MTTHLSLLHIRVKGGIYFEVKICSVGSMWTAISPRSAILLMSWCSPHLITYFKMSCSLACEREGGETERHRAGILPHSYFTKTGWRIWDFNNRLEQRHHFRSCCGSSTYWMSGPVTYLEYLKATDICLKLLCRLLASFYEVLKE